MPMIDACDQFIGKGITVTEPWRRCATCDHPKAQHELPHCHAQAIVAGVLYQCARRTPHDGPHRQDDAEWGNA